MDTNATDTGADADKAQAAEAAEIAEREEYLARKHARGAAVDDGDASHSEGAGAAGSAPDFGQPKNFSGVDDKGL